VHVDSSYLGRLHPKTANYGRKYLLAFLFHLLYYNIRETQTIKKTNNPIAIPTVTPVASQQGFWFPGTDGSQHPAEQYS
jgi:hypothetical protein